MKKRNKNAQSQVITVVLIILLVLALIVIVWNLVNLFLKNQTGDVEENAGNLEGIIKIGDIKMNAREKMWITATYEKGNKPMDKLRFIFYDMEGVSHFYDIPKAQAPGPLESKTYEIKYRNAGVRARDIKLISAAPIYSGKTGTELPETEELIQRASDGYRKVYLYDDADDSWIVSADDVRAWWEFDTTTQLKDEVGWHDGEARCPTTGCVGPSINNEVLETDDDNEVLIEEVPSTNELNSELARDDEITISLWMNPSDAGLNTLSGQGIIKRGWNSVDYRGQEYSLRLNNNILIFMLSNGVNFPSSYASKSGIINNKWYHVVAILRDDNPDESQKSVELWVGDSINPISLVSKTKQGFVGGFDPVSHDLRQTIGSLKWDGAFFNGKIDDAMIWKRALSEREIKRLYSKQNIVRP